VIDGALDMSSSLPVVNGLNSKPQTLTRGGIDLIDGALHISCHGRGHGLERYRVV
jgi:hypothetical protein